MELPSGAAAGLENLMPFKNEFRAKLKDHFGKDPAQLPIVSEKFVKYNHANVFLAIEDYVKVAGRSAVIHGFQGGMMQTFKAASLAELTAPATAATVVGFGALKEGPVQYTNVPLSAGGHKLACIQTGLYLIKAENERLAVLLRSDEMFGMDSGACNVEVMAVERKDAEKFLSTVRAAISKRSIYRGKCISLAASSGPMAMGAMEVEFHSLPEITRDKIILPEGLLMRIERQSVDATKYREALLESKRRLKRGLLLHGAPGTGKTLTAMYLASQMKERTVIMMTGRALGLLEQSCAMARGLQPAMVIIEDVDLIGEERTQQKGCATPLLFELLNEMDGLSDDCDVMFLLTTNRPDILEPALAARPGRIDQAFEVPLPDADCRRRLFELYSQGMKVEVDDMEPFIKRTDGASAAFINELMRKAALFAAPDGRPIVVKDRHVDEALHELIVEGGLLTRSLLGFQKIGFRAGVKD
jgi:hypothetical protein